MNESRRTYRGYRVKLLLLVIALAAATSLVSCSGRFTERAHQDQLRGDRHSTDVKVTFSGVSTLLVEDGKTQILIDGYFSRAPHIPLITRIEPDLAQIRNASQALNLKGFTCATGECLADCPDAQHRGLSWGIPVHAHYDHAMDSVRTTFLESVFAEVFQLLGLVWRPIRRVRYFGPWADIIRRMIGMAVTGRPAEGQSHVERELELRHDRHEEEVIRHAKINASRLIGHVRSDGFGRFLFCWEQIHERFGWRHSIEAAIQSIGHRRYRPVCQ